MYNKKNTEVTEMKEFTTVEKLALGISTSYDAIVRYKGFVCLATLNYKGKYEAEIYEYVDEPGLEFAEVECRLALNEKSAKPFDNSGEAIKWCFDIIECQSNDNK